MENKLVTVGASSDVKLESDAKSQRGSSTGYGTVAKKEV
jgi:hypothetical protein